MPEAPPRSLPALRQLLRERFPRATHSAADPLATGVPAIDEATGGLPRPALTEFTCEGPSCGSALLLGALLAATRAAALRLALVDADDAFDPDSWEPDLLEHLLWVRARGAAEALAAADLLARDANLGVVVLDLLHTPLAALRRIPSTAWYRLQRAVEPTTLAVVVLTPVTLVPSARVRFELTASSPLPALSRERATLVAALAPALRRQRTGAVFAAAG
jgi:hypothetical protein